MQFLKIRNKVIINQVNIFIIGTWNKHRDTHSNSMRSGKLFLYLFNCAQKIFSVAAPGIEFQCLFFLQCPINIIYEEADLIYRCQIDAHNIAVFFIYLKGFGLSSHIIAFTDFFHKDMICDQVIHYVFYGHNADMVFLCQFTPGLGPVPENALHNIYNIYISDTADCKRLFFICIYSH